MPRFFIKKEDIGQDNRIVLRGADAAHISLSLRMRTGDKLTVCDGAGHDYFCRIDALTHDEAILIAERSAQSLSEPSVRVSLFQALPKGDKFEWILQKCVELGVSEIVPVLTSRCISRPDEKAAEKKRKRWNAIAEEAAKQSGRGIIPTVTEILSYEQALERMRSADKSFFCYENETEDDLKRFCEEKMAQTPKNLSFFVGPEGGIAPEEAKAAADAGICSVSLGARILRTETAPLCVLSGIMLYTDNLK